MGDELVLDTGALVSLLDRRQIHHDACRAVLDRWHGPILSTEAVLTEAVYLLNGVNRGPLSCVDFFLAGGSLLVPSTPASLLRVRELLEKYEDLPMDFADATVVALAEEVETLTVFTTDRRDFSIYRWKNRRAFRILPEIM